MAPLIVEIATLGPLSVTRGGSEVALRPAQRRLLGTLLLDRRRVWTLDELADWMWTGEPPEGARNVLHVHLSGIRRALPGLVESVPGGYRLAPDGWRHDRDAFEAAGRACLQALGRGEWEMAIDLGREAAAMWRHHPAPELVDDARTIAELAPLHDLRVRVLEATAEAGLATGQTDTALEAARQAIAADGLRDRPRELAMLALHRSGRAAAALREYQDYRRHLGEATGLEPGPQLRDLEERILMQADSLTIAAAPSPHNLPRPGTNFVGRTAELEELSELIDTGHVVTVAGAPGVGKTRLAVETARMLLDRHPAGVWLVPVGGARDAAALTASIAVTLSLAEPDSGLENLATDLRPRPLLLILDACESALDPVRRLLAALVSEPGLCRVLATSRVAIGLPGEAVLRLEARGDDAAVELLADRVRAVDRRYALTAERRTALAGLAARVDGNPLALELLARWIPTLGLADTDRLLRAVHADGAVAAAFDWSRQLLAAEDRSLLPVLAGFAAPFTLGSADLVCTGRSEAGVAGSIARLVDASLLAIDAAPGAIRYRMLDPIGELSRDALTDRERAELRRRHAAARVATAPEVESALQGTGQAEALRSLDIDMPDYRNAFEVLRQDGSWPDLVRLVPALANYWYARFLGWEGRSWLAAIPHSELDDASRLRVQRAAGFLAWAMHDYDDADRSYRDCLAIGRRRHDRRAVADALYGLGLIHQKRRFADGAAMLEEAAAIYRSLGGCDRELGECLLFRGIDEACNADPDRGERLLGEAVELLQRTGHLRQVSKAERWRAHAAWRRGDAAEAHQHATRAEAMARDVGDHIALAGAEVEQANLAITWGDPADAARRLIAALEPVPADDEVDRSQVLQPIARLALARGEPDLAAGLLAYISDVYDRHGWRPLDDDPAARELRSRVAPVPVPDREELLDLVTQFLRREAEQGG